MPEPIPSLWILFWANLNTIGNLIIIGSAIVALIAYSLRAYRQVKLKVDITNDRPQGVNWIKHDFYWRVKNVGHSPCDELSISIIPSVTKRPVCRIAAPRLQAKGEFLLGFEYVKDSSPPKFELQIAASRLFDMGTLNYGGEREFEAHWGKSYSVVLSYHYENSDSTQRTFMLRTGDKDTPVEQFEELES